MVNQWRWMFRIHGYLDLTLNLILASLYRMIDMYIPVDYSCRIIQICPEVWAWITSQINDWDLSINMGTVHVELYLRNLIVFVQDRLKYWKQLYLLYKENYISDTSIHTSSMC